MPLFRVLCQKCGAKGARMLSKASDIEATACKKCGETTLERELQAPSTQILETIDNGHVAKAVVRFKDAIPLHKEHAQNDPRKKPLY